MRKDRSFFFRLHIRGKLRVLPSRRQFCREERSLSRELDFAFLFRNALSFARARPARFLSQLPFFPGIDNRAAPLPQPPFAVFADLPPAPHVLGEVPLAKHEALLRELLNPPADLSYLLYTGASDLFPSSAAGALP